MRFLIFAFFGGLPLLAQYKVTPPTVIAETNRFVFHLNFWENLHHTLIQNGKLMGTDREPKLDRLSEADQKIWRSAAFYYKQHVPQDPLDPKAVAYKNTLRDWVDPPDSDAVLPDELRQMLIAAAPAYRSVLWPNHRNVCQNLLRRMLPLIRSSEDWFASRLAQRLGSSWPADLVPVDLVVTGHWAPGYTTRSPGHVVLLAGHPRIKENPYALEILYHEASHLMASKLEADVNDACKRAGRAPQPGLSHAMLFYTTGMLTREYWDQNPQHKQKHQPYANHFGLYDKSWPKIFPLLENHWQAYLSGNLDYQMALTEIVAGLP